MSENSSHNEHLYPEDEATSHNLIKAINTFGRIAKMRDQAAALRQRNDAKNEEYNPLETLKIPGGSSLMAGYIGMVASEAAVSFMAERLESKANMLAQEVLGSEPTE